MGREALVHAEIDEEAGEVMALLEARELILRGAIRRHFPKAEIADVRVDGAALVFLCAGERARLDLGEEAAKSWCRAILTPPPGLRAKLGLDNGAKALVIGPCDDDAELAEALNGACTAFHAEAAMVVARIDGPADLAAAQAACVTLPLWAVYPKGRGVMFGATAIRTLLREAGWRDTKSCAVSSRHTATRYHPA